MVTTGALIALLGIAVVVGALIGCVGVGGVLLAPALVAVGGLDAHAATATSTWVFLCTGAIGTWRYSRGGDVPWRLVGWLAVGVVPAAVLGVWVNQLLPADAVLLAVAAVAIVAGVQALRSGRSRAARPLGRRPAVLTGALVGFGSALTGTGGPVLLIPALLVLGSSPLVAVAAGQVIQLPVVGVASVGYLATGAVLIGIGTVLGIAAGAGVLIGAAVAKRVGAEVLRRIVGIACCAAGLLIGATTLLRF